MRHEKSFLLKRDKLSVEDVLNANSTIYTKSDFLNLYFNETKNDIIP